MNKVCLGLALSFSLLAAACGGEGNKCEALAKKICDGKDDAYCKKSKDWLDKEMVGPKDEKLSAKEAEVACAMILEDETVLKAYAEHAAEELAH